MCTWSQTRPFVSLIIHDTQRYPWREVSQIQGRQYGDVADGMAHEPAEHACLACGLPRVRHLEGVPLYGQHAQRAQRIGAVTDQVREELVLKSLDAGVDCTHHHLSVMTADGRVVVIDPDSVPGARFRGCCVDRLQFLAAVEGRQDRRRRDVRIDIERHSLGGRSAEGRAAEQFDARAVGLQRALKRSELPIESRVGFESIIARVPVVVRGQNDMDLKFFARPIITDY